MKAYVVNPRGTVQNVHCIQVHEPSPKAGEVVVKVKASAVNPADIKVITGKDGGKFIHSSRSPIRLGFDFSGVIETVGSAVTQFKIGEEVFGFLPYSTGTTQGAFAEKIAVAVNSIARKPRNITHEQAAAAATVGLTAWQCLTHLAHLESGKTVFINGASGGVGSMAVQMAIHQGGRVIATCSEGNIDFVKSLGAQEVHDYKTMTPDDLPEAADVVLDAASNLSFSRWRKLLAPKGTWITLLPSASFLGGKMLSLFSGQKLRLCMVQPQTAHLEKLAELMEAQVISVPIAATKPFEQLPEALREFSRHAQPGKVVIRID